MDRGHGKISPGFFSLPPVGLKYSAEAQTDLDQVKILLRHNCSPGALGVQSKLTTIASNPCNHGNLGLHFLLFCFAMGNEAFILSSLWSSKTACLEGFREVLRYIKICSASRRALRMPILAGPVGSSRIISW